MNRLLCALVLLSLATSCRKTPESTTSVRPISPMEAPDLDPASDVLHVRLVADASTNEGFIYAYSGQNPGPTLKAKVGDTLRVELVNQLSMPTTIHWHGLHVPFDMDGVTWMRDPVAAGATFTYTFTLNQTGTFWYHPHFNTDRQVEGGLYGMLIVEDPTEPVSDEELVLIFDAADEPAAGHTAHGHGKIVTKWRVNGVVVPTFRATGGSSVRVRILNASNSGYLAFSDPQVRVIAHDQGLLPQLQTPDMLVLAPGDRAELQWQIAEDGFVFKTLPYSLNGGLAYGDPVPVLAVQVATPSAAPPTVPYNFTNAAPRPDPGHTDVLYAFAGTDRAQDWAINAERFPNITIQEIALGQGAVIEVRNLSSTEHPFHIHGMTFEVLSVNGIAPSYKRIEDTVNLRIRDIMRVFVEPTVAGDWMAHCHILPHAEDGMMTVLRVSP